MIATLSGILLAIAVLVLFWKRPAALPWWTLLLGVGGALALAGAFSFRGPGTGLGPRLFQISLAFSLAGAIVGLFALRGVCTWPLWVGLASALGGAGFWAWFFMAELGI